MHDTKVFLDLIIIIRTTFFNWFHLILFYIKNIIILSFWTTATMFHSDKVTKKKMGCNQYTFFVVTNIYFYSHTRKQLHWSGMIYVTNVIPNDKHVFCTLFDDFRELGFGFEQVCIYYLLSILSRNLFMFESVW